MQTGDRLTAFLLSRDPRPAAVLVSCLFSLLAIASNAVLNDDAYGYLRAAELFQTDGMAAVLDNYGWYGYSILIALVNQALPVGLLNAAYLLNIAAYGLLVHAFITLVTEYRRVRRVQWLAALVILAFPMINEMRHILVRDFFFWAFCVLALLNLVRYHLSGRAIHGAFWCLSMLAATFFRLEGILLMLLTPLSLLANRGIAPGRRLGAWLELQGMLLAGLGGVYLAAMAAGIDLIDLFQYAYRWYLPRLENLGEMLTGTADRLSDVIFAPQNFPGNSGHGVVVLILAYLYTLAVNLVNAMSVPLSGLFLYGLVSRKYRVMPHVSLPAAFFLAASLLALLIFILIMHFLTQRYAALACIILLSFIPLCLDTLMDRAAETGTLTRFRAVFGFFVFYFLVDSLISFGYSKTYIREAAAWLQDNVETGNALYTNDYAIAYYSGRIPGYDAISREAETYLPRLDQGDYLAVALDHDQQALRSEIESTTGLAPAADFANERGDVIRIYRMQGRPGDRESSD